MRVRIVQTPDATSFEVKLAVNRWSCGQWEPVRTFELHESDQAYEFAMKLSMTKRIPVERAVFEDGKTIMDALAPPVGKPSEIKP